MARNQLLLYTVESLLAKANPEGRYFGQVAFYKMLYDLSCRLKTRGVDIKLPYSWYRYGTLVDRGGFEAQTGVSLLEYAPEGRGTKRIQEIRKYNISPDEERIVDEELIWLLSEYPDREYLENQNREALLDKNYAKAPLRFQYWFNRKLIKYLEETNNFPYVYLTNENIARIEDLLDVLLEKYPEQELPELFSTYLEWDDTFRLAIEYDQSRLLPLARGFWETFVNLLRTKYNENIPIMTLINWESYFEKVALPEYEKKLEGERKELLRVYVQQTPDDDVMDTVYRIMHLSRELATSDK